MTFSAVEQTGDRNGLAELRQVMSDHVGVARDAKGLRQALVRIAALEEQNAQSETFLNMSATATLIAAAAFQRRESRGAHYRTDFPDTPAGRGERSVLTLHQALEIRRAAQKDSQ